MLRSGDSVVVDAACTTRWQRQLIAQAARDAKTPLTWVAPQVPEAELLARVEARSRHGRDASDATTAILHNQLASFEPITSDELQAHPNTQLIHTLAPPVSLNK